MSTGYKWILKYVFENAEECDCNQIDCHPKNHRLCYLCNATILKCAHISKQKRSDFSWDVYYLDHTEKTDLNNWVIAHTSCADSR